MNDVTFTMDEIRRAAFALLYGAKTCMQPESFSYYASGVVDLIRDLCMIEQNIENERNAERNDH